MNCPQCNDDCYRDEVDIGVGVQYGPWRCCSCGWYEGHEVDAAIDADRDAETIPCRNSPKCHGVGKVCEPLGWIYCDECWKRGGDRLLHAMRHGIPENEP